MDFIDWAVSHAVDIINGTGNMLRSDALSKGCLNAQSSKIDFTYTVHHATMWSKGLA